jgi:hypothetical protein
MNRAGKPGSFRKVKIFCGRGQKREAKVGGKKMVERNGAGLAVLH